MKHLLWLTLALVTMLVTRAWTQTTTPPATEERIKQLVTQLGDTDFKKREAATTELKAIGKPALPQLKAAENHTDPEVRARVTDLLAALNPPATTTGTGTTGVGRAQVLRLGGGMGEMVFRVQGGVVNVGGQQNVQSKSQTSFTEDGKKYTVTRTENNGVKNLTVEVTETKDGKEVTRTVEAEDDEALAKKDAALAKIVAKHAGQADANAAVQIQMDGNIVIGGQAEAVAITEVLADTPVPGMGLKVADLEQGVRVAEVEKDSTAAKLGLQKDDVILKINAKEMSCPEDVAGAFAGLKDKDPLVIEALRAGKPVTLKR
jgi:type II secretory pathway component PulC